MIDTQKFIENLHKEINDMTVIMNTEFHTQFEEMYGKVDVLYKELAEVNELLDTAKETFLGKYIIK